MDHQNMVRATCSAPRHEPGFQVALGLIPAHEAVDELARVLVENLQEGELDGLASHPLFRMVLETAIVTDYEFEQLLTGLRYALLQSVVFGRGESLDDTPWLQFLCSLAQQCFLDEYIFTETTKEFHGVARLRREVSDRMADNGGSISPSRVALLGCCYGPLHQLDGVAGILAYDWPADLRPVLIRQIEQHMQEEHLQETIPRLTPIEAGVSSDVRAQYEENPYPRW